MSNNYTDSPTTVFLIVYIITFLIGFPHSALAFCTSIRKIHNKPIPMTFFMLNLAVSDLIFLTFLPVKMKEAMDNMVWNMPYILCQFNLFMFFLPIYSSSLFLAAISAERYVCVTFPVKYRSPRRINYTILICVCIWVLVIVTTVFAYKAAYTDSDEVGNITNQHPLVTEPQRCFFNFTANQLEDLLKMRLVAVVLFFCAPLIVCCFCYINVIRILSKLHLISRCRRLRAIGLALGTLLVFAICFAPFSASHLVGYIRRENPKWRMKALMLSTLNACFDTIIFFCISSEMRTAIKVCTKGIFQFYTYIKRFLLLLFYA